ncbi:hypothetical protein [Actinophytocola sp.]|uniref:hypothetical protein n=1 Tax=Actinophytocola sp. TaxID=1872138 RepID=UPI002D803BD2|nr:hypothetical protein [Actinophytocola sp.]HET9144111.1 hypothetical protein [Actinophytocola sp.]
MTEPNKILNIDSLARGDSHMVARFLDTWNAAKAERRTWPLPFDADYEKRMEGVSTDKHHAATLLLGVLAGTWTRHLLREAGVKDGDLPPPTSAQQRRLIRMMNEHGRSGDDGLELLTSWAHCLLVGRTQQLHYDFERLAGDMRVEVLESVVNHVRRTSPQFNGADLKFATQPVGVPPIGSPETRAQVAAELKRRIEGEAADE